MGTIRILFASILGFHGLIHLTGFVRGRYLTKAGLLPETTIIPLSEPETKAVGVFWLVTGLFFLTAAGGFLTGMARWWLVAFGAILFSQLLILLHWQAAKTGTVMNLIALIISLPAYADWKLTIRIQAEIQGLMSQVNTEKPSVITIQQVETLPPVVRKWLISAQVPGKERIQTVQLKQQGQMRTKATGNWMPVEAQQCFTTDKPGFIWSARIKAAPLFYLAGRDKYDQGHGNMLIKALSFWPIANASGKEIDQGTMLRFLAELVWFPTAALNPYIHWEELSATTARATMNYGKVTASGVFTFTPEGDVIRFVAQRYGEFEGTYRLETWSIAMKNHQKLAGIRIPVEASVTWKLKTGDFTWYVLRITEIHYNERCHFTSSSSGSTPASWH
ncbi:DUF6544 family protein [Larkinella rosea]|uniref:Uncharacterized protein n=1 Tax=Larkinella rosea TaxID=2025312 RepID=A0A3P1BFW3_9BACT|nr:DUF6544 family protein [Larkinella rosea]RRB00007.1 hypothetical protein EHT25_25620 [Larkinella rosea]